MALWHACTSKLACSYSVVHRSPQCARYVVHGEQDVRTTAARRAADRRWDGSQSVGWQSWHNLRIMDRPNGRAARCGSARWSALPHGRTGVGVGGLCFSRLRRYQVSSKRQTLCCTVAKQPAREPPLRPQQLHLCCQSNNTRRRCNRCLLPSYLTQLLPRLCLSFASSISTTSGPTTSDDDPRRRPAKPVAYRSRYRHACPTRLPFARGPRPPAHTTTTITTRQTHTNQHPIPSITLCILDSPTTTTNYHPANRAISSLITNSLHRILRRAYPSTSPPIPHIGGFE
jgi:hypothetical protein